MTFPSTPQELVEYYVNTLIIQYAGKPKATGTIASLAGMSICPLVTTETITFASAPTSGAFTLFYGSLQTASISWNDSATTIQTKLRALTGLGSVTVAGSVASLLLTVTFTGVIPPALNLALGANTLVASAVPVIPVITETDVTLPIAVQNAFNMLAPIAQGVQLDVLGKYTGVTRTGSGFFGTITLNDSDFLSLIIMAIGRNTIGSSLSAIAGYIYSFFPNEMYVYDELKMRMSYLISSAVGSQQLVQLFVTEGLLPRPMGVALAGVIYNPTVNNFFSFRTYSNPAYPATASPFNNYSSYQLTYPWLSYAMAIHA